jgi:deazaflavin-dependent oxidoreductase (nitroreductase family)
VYVPERKHNPFLNSATGGRVLSGLQLPWFILVPPRGFGAITTTGRKSGKARRKCVRAIRRGNRAYIVAIRGASTGWLRNILANPNVSLRVRGGTFSGRARELSGAPEVEQARAAYCETVNATDYAECLLWRKGRPTRSKIEGLHRDWFDQGIPLVVELESG